MANNTLLAANPALSEDERASRKRWTRRARCRRGCRYCWNIGVVSALGTAGLSAAGISSGLATIGAAVGGMASGVVIATAAPVAAAIGYGAYRLVQWLRE